MVVPEVPGGLFIFVVALSSGPLLLAFVAFAAIGFGGNLSEC